MKKSFALLLATTVLAAPALGYKQEDLDKLKATNSCEKCDLIDADLSEANLAGSNLTGAVLRDAQIDFADFTNAKLCNTVMPDGQRIFQDCSRDIGKDK